MKDQLIPEGVIERRIFIIRGHKVMLDRDLAGLYGVETRVLNQAVRRNKDRFPDDFMFSLTREEIMNLSQIVISSKIKHAPNVFVFTEQGVSMLSGVLNSKRAIHVNIEIMRAFVRLNKMIRSHKGLLSKMREMENKYDAQFKVVFDAIRQLMAPSLPKSKRIITGFKPDK
ncbi:MAG: DNA-binding protein [Candidatus Omnitrophica bacterium CG_4_9_14_0_2_um_filter_42_8]|nr:MAG: DNA-binding protein [Candidatus Omnitrophica bacterium CG22_combo_CG10-13_8_21_14_all_43_16]PJC48463.1 MAG: DNA-binding protein [Candidatus Omnitrophica bacterium CG_4_9_14_0_2_um_filter_42_8]